MSVAHPCVVPAEVGDAGDEGWQRHRVAAFAQQRHSSQHDQHVADQGAYVELSARSGAVELSGPHLGDGGAGGGDSMGEVKARIGRVERGGHAMKIPLKLSTF